MEAKELIIFGMEHVKRSLERVLEGLTPEEMLWHPKPDANSIGLILFHIARFSDLSVGNLQGKPQIWESEKWYQKLNKAADDRGSQYTAEQVDKFSIDTQLLQEYLKEVQQKTLEFANSLTADILDQKITVNRGHGAPPMELTGATLLLRSIMHATQHFGEISYIRGLKRGMDG